MKSKLLYLGLSTAISAGILILSGHKVDICHVPPGNPENVQTINISKAAAVFHLLLHEGDSEGACEDPGEEPSK